MRTGPKRGPSLKRGKEPDQDQDQDRGFFGHQDQDQDQDQDQGQDQDQEPDQLPSQALCFFAAAAAFRRSGRSSRCTRMLARFSAQTIFFFWATNITTSLRCSRMYSMNRRLTRKSTIFCT